MSPRLQAPEGILAVPGIQAMGIAAGIKKERRDVALIYSSVPSTGAAVFTQNAFAAAPVHISRQHVADGDIRAIVVNSGSANACTGRQGLRDALKMAEETASALGIRKDQVIVCSTGIIGRPLPMEKIIAGIQQCAIDLPNAVGGEAAQAILTTDSGPKQTVRTCKIDGKSVTIAGMAKGAGMIHPNMATMLAFMATDAAVDGKSLRMALKAAVDMSFNQISVDGDESTNDTAAILATGLGPAIDPAHPDWEKFVATITGVCTDLARRIAADGEGATRLLEVNVTGAATDSDARIAARRIVASNLVKAALHGGDPNWGRIVAAIGSTHADIDTEKVSITVRSAVGTEKMLWQGEPTGDLEAARAALGAPEVFYDISLGDGPGVGRAWGCDLSEDYVKFNAEYST